MSYWSNELRTRLGDRDDLGWSRVCERYWPHLPAEELVELFELFEQEFPIPAGMLRPSDSLKCFSKPMNSWNPLKVLFGEVERSDHVSELDYQLTKRLEKRGVKLNGAPLETVDEIVRCWCGQVPGRLSAPKS